MAGCSSGPPSPGPPQEQHQGQESFCRAAGSAEQALSLLGFLPSSEIIFFPLNNHYEPFLFLT